MHFLVMLQVALMMMIEPECLDVKKKGRTARKRAAARAKRNQITEQTIKEKNIQIMMRFGLYRLQAEDPNQRPITKTPRNYMELVADICYRESEDFRDAIKSVNRFLHEKPMNINKVDGRCCKFLMTHQTYKELEDMDDEQELEYIMQEYGRTYARFLELAEYGGNGFANNRYYGKCRWCGIGINAFRRCLNCVRQYVIREENIFIISHECNNRQHQRDLEEIVSCENCWGPDPAGVNRLDPIPPPREEMRWN